MKIIKRISLIILFSLFSLTLLTTTAYGADIQALIEQGLITPEALAQLANLTPDDPLFEIGVGGESVQASSAIQIIFLFTLIGLAPTLLVMMTAFTRIIIVLHFLRSALGTQQMPPNQILIGLALFLTFFLMGPMFTQINDTALQPYFAGEVAQEEAIVLAIEPLRYFMMNQLDNGHLRELGLFADLAQISVEDPSEIPMRIIIPAFILHELTQGFIFGFFLFIPFLVIDMVVASVLMAMGMMMLPPAMISTPFKIILFVMVDGWTMIVEMLVTSFRIT